MAVKESFKTFVASLLGISTFNPPDYPGPQLGDREVDEARTAYGGRLEAIPPVRLRWYPPDIERAQMLATNGDMTMIGQLNESMRIDGVYRGLLDARTSVTDFPKRFYGEPDVIETLTSKNLSDRNVYDEMIPSSEARLMVGDTINCGISVGEMVPVEGRDFPVLVRRYVQNLYYLWSRNTWLYRSIVGLIPIHPGRPYKNGNQWVLHIGGGRLSPWNNGLWNTCGRSYINKTQTIFARQSYEMKHSHPARVAFSPLGASEEERQGMLASIIRWALNACFALPVGWDIKLVESNGRGIDIYEKSIDTYNQEMATALCGSSVMLKGTVGFGNIDPFKVVAKNLMATSAGDWDHTCNTQILPAFIGRRWGEEKLRNATTVQTDVSEPLDRLAEAGTMVQLAAGIKNMVEAINAAQIAMGVEKPVALDVTELLSRFGIPTKPGAVLLALPAANDTEPQTESAAAEE